MSRVPWEPLILHRNERFHVSLLAGQRPRVILNGAWHPEVGEYMATHEIGDLSLNTGCGWTGGGIEFLATAPRLRSVAVLDWKTRDLRPLVAHRDSLEHLVLECNVKQTPRLSELPALRNLNCKWSPGLDGIFDGVAHRLHTLVVGNWPYEHLEAITALQELRRLAIVGSKRLRDLTALGDRVGLEELTLHRCASVTSFDVVASCTGLRDLELTSKVIPRLDFVQGLSRLERLIVDGSDIQSLALLASLPGLKRVGFSGRILDSDLSPLLGLSLLEWVGIRRRKEYRPSVQVINDSCAHRRTDPYGGWRPTVN